MTTNTQSWPKRCNVCGTLYTREQWAALKPKGIINYGEGTALDYRDCPCHNTMTIAVVPQQAEVSHG